MIDNLKLLAVLETPMEPFWPFFVHHPIAIFGVLMMFSGILLGNMGIWKMMDAAESDAPAKREMFSTGSEVDPINPSRKRSMAISAYRETQPSGPFLKMLRGGQFVTVAGALIMLIGIFV